MNAKEFAEVVIKWMIDNGYKEGHETLKKEAESWEHDYPDTTFNLNGSVLGLPGFMTWKDTPEGFEYWLQVYEKLRNEFDL